MAHFAKLDDAGKVLEVNVVNNSDINDLPFPESEPIGIAFLTKWSGGYSNWKQTSYSGAFRGHLAGKGDRYDATLNIFIRPKPLEHPSFVLNISTGYYEPPIPMPTEGGPWSWDESIVNWVEMQQLPISE